MASLDTIPLSGSSIQTVSYLPVIGLPSLQVVSYDLLSTTHEATLLEDGDGIAPSGSITCDRTPTVSWTAASGMGPFLYTWTCYRGSSTSGSVMASGTTLNETQATLPELPFSGFLFTLSARDASGSLASMRGLLFTLYDCDRTSPVTLNGYDPTLSADEQLDAFQIEPVVPPEDDYIRYLPQWMSVHGTATAPPSGSLLFRFLQPSIRQVKLVRRSLQTTLDEFTLLQAPARLPRQAWHMQTRFTPRDTITVVVQASGTTLPVRRSPSLYAFYTADEPTYLVGGAGHALFRNLAQRTVTVSPVSGTTGATGAVLEMLTHRYVLPFEVTGIVADTDVFFRYAGVDYRMKAGSIGIDPLHATLQLPSLFTGDLLFHYQSRTLATALTVSLSGQPFLTPSAVDLPNRFDELAVLAGLVRRRDEDNLAFRQRIYARFITRLGVTLQSAAQHISQDLNQVMLLDWDGRSTLSLAASGLHGVRQVDVRGLPQWAGHVEELIASDSQTFTASQAAWRSGWFLTVDGIPATPLRYPGLSLTENRVSFGAAVSGRVVAAFQADNYGLSYSGQGFVTEIVPVSGNVPSGLYQVVLSQNCRIFVPSDPGYQRVYLLNPDGTPNGFFNELRARLLEGSPNHFSRARWGEGAAWLSQTEDLPPIDHLPAILDQGVP